MALRLTLGRLMVSAAVMFTLAFSPVTAQQRGKRRASRGKRRPPIAAIPAPPARLPMGRVWKEYDPEEHTTNIGVNFVPLAGLPLTGKSVAASYSYPGETPTKPKTVRLLLMEVVGVPKGDTGDRLTITADGMELLTSTAIYLGTGELVLGGVPGMHGARIPVEAFEVMTNARGVEIRVGAESYKLSGESLTALRALASYMNRKIKEEK